MKLTTLFLLLTLFIGSFSFNAQESAASNWSQGSINTASFIENKGQFNGRNWRSNEDIQFGYNQNPFYIFFTKKGLTYRFDKMVRTPGRQKTDYLEPKRTNVSELIFADWIGANENVELVAEDRTDDYHSYAINDPQTKEVRNINYINGYKKITYKNLYDNIDVEYLIHASGGVKYNIILHPNADLSQVKLRYSSAKTSTTKEEFIDFKLNDEGQVEINTSVGSILEHAPITFYKKSKNEIGSKYKLENNVLSFELENYDNSKTVVIDPWIISPTYTTSTAAWEVETDAVGNVYSIGGETPMQLKKYNSAGVAQWTYTTPWDTSNVWLGTLATDNNGNSYVTSGVTANMHKVNNAGAMVWTTNLNGVQQLQWNSEWWSITFNCDKTKLLVGGTWADGIFPSGFFPGLYEIDMATGAVISDQILDNTPGGFGATPIEVRSISSSIDGRYIFLTHNDVGAIDQNQVLCGVEEVLFRYDNQKHLGYKCENYLPATQNGGGLKALIANNDYFYTHTGNQVHRWNLTTGALINSVTLTGGTSTTVPLIGGLVVQNSGLAVDDCGNVYAGSGDRVVKFDPNLVVISSTPTTFRVYDVSVNSNGEVIACGAQQNNSATNRNGRIESLNMTACAQYTTICCDASICEPDPVCITDAPFTLVTSAPGGTFSGTGVNPTTGLFSPSVAGIGTHAITYSMVCATETVTETISVVVNACTALIVCEETNGDFTVTGGSPTYTWQNWQTTTVSSNDCVACGGILFVGNCIGATLPCNITANGWVTFGTGTTVTPPVGATSIQLTDGSGTILAINPATVPACVSNPCPTITLSTTTQTNVLCFGNSTGSATVAASGGNGTYTYTWNPGNLSGPTRTSLAAGTYTINVVDGNGCTGTGTVTITQPSSAVSVSMANTPATCGASNGSATATVSGGTTSYTYAWSPSGGSGATASNLAAGPYSVLITDGNGCQVTGNTTVTSSGSPTISVTSSNDITCNGLTNGSATVAGAGGNGTLSYSWMPGSLTGATQNALDNTTYTVTVTDQSGCTNSTTVTINEPTALTVNMGSTQATCGASNGSATATVSGGTTSYTYAWSPSGGSGATASNLAAGPYSVLITDGNGCQVTGNTTVGSSGGPTISVSSFTDITCNGLTDGSATVAGAGGTGTLSYTWMPGSLNGATQNALDNTTYTVTVTDQGGCTNSTTVTINEPTALTVNMGSTQATCGASNGSATATPLGGTTPYSYTWSPGGGTGTTASNLASGPYSVLITDDNGCQVTGNTTVGSSGGPTISVSSFTDITCNGLTDGSATVAGTGGTGTLSYTWMPGSLTGATQNALDNTTYTVTVTDQGGCSNSTTVTIGEPSAIVLTSGTITPANCGATDGAAAVNASGGTGTLNYIWSPNVSTTATANNIAAGSYSIIVEDQNDCSETINIVVTSIGGPTLTIASSSDVSCFGGNDGEATLNISGGTAPYTYTWSPTGGSGISATNLSAGTYTATATDDAGCVGSIDVTIGAPAQILIVETITDIICGSGNGAISIVASGGDGTYSYLWTPNGETTSSLSNLSPGTYSVTVTDGNGCEATENYTIAISGTLSISATPATSTINAGESVQLTASGATSYTWTPATGLSATNISNPIATPTASTTYIVTGTDANGCTGTALVNIYIAIECGELFLPTVFSPNGSGPAANNVLCVLGGCIAELNYAVYNRWGEKVFETTDNTICWDGLYKEKPVNSGVYAYKVYAVLFDGRVIEESGNLTIVR